MLELPRPESTRRIRQLEWPQKVARLLEIWPHGYNLMHQIFHADDTEFAEVLFDDLVVREGDSLLVDLSVSTLVNEVANGLHTGVAVGDVGFDYFEHFRSSFGKFDEDTIVDLEETEELHDLARFRSHLIDTDDSCQRARSIMHRGECLPLYANDEDKLRLGRHIEIAFLLR